MSNHVFSEELFPIRFAKRLNEFVFSEELFPISFAKLLNEFVFSEELPVFPTKPDQKVSPNLSKWTQAGPKWTQAGLGPAQVVTSTCPLSLKI